MIFRSTQRLYLKEQLKFSLLKRREMRFGICLKKTMIKILTSSRRNLLHIFKRSNYYRALKKWNNEHLEEYLDFIRTIPSPTTKANSLASSSLVEEYSKQNKKGKSFPYIQTTFLFSEMYFSLEQAIEIDSLKYAIDEISRQHPELSRVLQVALIHSYSYSSAGTGHFAQF